MLLRAFSIRWAAALALVLATFNPTGFSFFHWAQSADSIPLVLLSGLVLLVAYVIFFRATLRSIGFIGIALVLALLGALVWVFVDFGVIDIQNPGVVTWIGLIFTSLVLGIGISWSIIRRALTGQLDVDDVEERGG